MAPVGVDDGAEADDDGDGDEPEDSHHASSWVGIIQGGGVT
jgi:hypothetical protein